MSLIVDNYPEPSYTCVINSNDKISGTNNNGVYNIEWSQFLPQEFDLYKVISTFQSCGSYYSDGLFLSNNSTVSAANTTIAGYNSIVGNQTLTLASATGVVVGQLIVCAGVAGGTVITNISSNVITLSSAVVAYIPFGTSISFYASGTATSNINFSSARFYADLGTKNMSYGTTEKSPTVNLGIIQRDIQTTQSKSNTLSCFYCQNAPRTIARPTNNNINIRIYNNCSYSGGITAYNGTVPASYSTSVVNTNFFTDTNNSGSTISATNDMGPWQLYLEFVPVQQGYHPKCVNPGL